MLDFSKKTENSEVTVALQAVTQFNDTMHSQTSSLILNLTTSIEKYISDSVQLAIQEPLKNIFISINETISRFDTPEISNILEYINEHKDFIDDSMTISEAVEKINYFYKMQNQITYTPKQANILSSISGLLSTLPTQIQQENLIFIALIALALNIIEKEHSK